MFLAEQDNIDPLSISIIDHIMDDCILRCGSEDALSNETYDSISNPTDFVRSIKVELDWCYFAHHPNFIEIAKHYLDEDIDPISFVNHAKNGMFSAARFLISHRNIAETHHISDITP